MKHTILLNETAQCEAIAQRCEEAHRYKDGWRARCPAHQGESNTSLSITPAPGRVLLHCFSGCSFTEILRPLCLEQTDLFIQGESLKDKLSLHVTTILTPTVHSASKSAVRTPKGFSNGGRTRPIWGSGSTICAASLAVSIMSPR